MTDCPPRKTVGRPGRKILDQRITKQNVGRSITFRLGQTGAEAINGITLSQGADDRDAKLSEPALIKGGYVIIDRQRQQDTCPRALRQLDLVFIKRLAAVG